MTRSGCIPILCNIKNIGMINPMASHKICCSAFIQIFTNVFSILTGVTNMNMDEKYRKAYKARAAPVPKKHVPER